MMEASSGPARAGDLSDSWCRSERTRESGRGPGTGAEDSERGRERGQRTRKGTGTANAEGNGDRAEYWEGRRAGQEVVPWRSTTWVIARATPATARAARARKVIASAWADTCRNAPRAACPGSRPARFRYSVPNVATPTSRPSWFTVTTTPVASAASSTGTRSSTRVISGLNAAAIPAPDRAPIRYRPAPPVPPERSTQARPAMAAANRTKPPTIRALCHLAGSRRQFRLTRAKAAAVGAKVRPARSGE